MTVHLGSRTRPRRRTIAIVAALSVILGVTAALSATVAVAIGAAASAGAFLLDIVASYSRRSDS